MSNNNVEQDTQALAAAFKAHEQAEAQNKQVLDEISKKSLEVKQFKVDQEYKRITEAKKIQSQFANLKIDFSSKERIKQIQASNAQYLENARKRSMVFLHKDFNNVVPYQPNQLILVGARTGRGKSTTSANLAHRAVLQGQRVLVLSNEEKAGDVYNRVTAMIKGRSYSNHSSLSEEEVKEYDEYIEKLSERLSVVDDEAVGDVSGMSVLEIMKGYLSSAVDQDLFDVIIIDYYQKVDTSLEHSKDSVYEVQHRFASFLGDLIKKTGCPPIVLMCQLKPDDKEGRPIEERIEGRRIIAKSATCILEAAPDYERHCTNFIVHKTRFSENNGKTIPVGFLKGRYVEYNTAFKESVVREKERIAREKLQKIAMSEIKPTNTVNGD